MLDPCGVYEGPHWVAGAVTVEAAVGWAVTVMVAAERGWVVTVSGGGRGGGGQPWPQATRWRLSPLPRSTAKRAALRAPVGRETTVAVLESGHEAEVVSLASLFDEAGRVRLASTTRPRPGGR